MNKIDFALKYARLGIRVFPIVKNTKVPALPDWPVLATTDRATIERWWTIEPEYNVGVATGKGVIAVDADVKGGKPGLSSLEALDLEMLPQSFRTTTPSQGIHVLLRTKAPVANRVDSIEGYRGIDIRGENGYVLGAGSEIDGAKYTVLSNGKIEDMPDEFNAVLARRSQHREYSANPVTDLDDATSLEKAVQWLEHSAPDAVEGAGGDEATFRTAAWLRDLGLSEPAALDSMLDHWNDRQSPPWSPDDLALKVSNAYQYATGTWGGRSVHADFEPVEIELGERPVDKEVIAATKRRSRFTVFDADASHRQSLTGTALPLIEGIMNKGTFAVLYGKPKTSKTFNALDMGMCIALGRPWAGKYETSGGAVFYVAAEGGTSVHARVAAAKLYHNAPEHTPFYLLPAAVDLVGNDGDTKEIIRLATASAARSDTELSLIVIDTLNRSMGGGDENSGVDMGQFVKHVDMIREATKATVLVIHHTGKDEAKGMRGHSSLLGAIDTEIFIDSDGHLQTTNQRDLQENEMVATATLVDVAVGERPDGKKVSSAAVKYSDMGDFVDAMPLSDNEQVLFDVFASLVARARHEGRAAVLTWQEWVTGYRTHVVERGEVGEEAVSERALLTWSQNIIHAGWVMKKKRNQYVLSRKDA